MSKMSVPDLYHLVSFSAKQAKYLHWEINDWWATAAQQNEMYKANKRPQHNGKTPKQKKQLLLDISQSNTHIIIQNLIKIHTQCTSQKYFISISSVNLHGESVIFLSFLEIWCITATSWTEELKNIRNTVTSVVWCNIITI